MTRLRNMSEHPWNPLPGEITEAVAHCALKFGVDPAIDPQDLAAQLTPAELRHARALHAADCEVPA